MKMYKNRFQNQRIRLTTVKKQLYNPKLPTIRRIERDEVLGRLTDEHSRHTTTFTEGDFVYHQSFTNIFLLYRTISKS
jgi:hypothetical protein